VIHVLAVTVFVSRFGRESHHVPAASLHRTVTKLQLRDHFTWKCNKGNSNIRTVLEPSCERCNPWICKSKYNCICRWTL